MRKLGSIAAAALVAGAFPLMTASANAQADRPAGGGAAARPAAPSGGGPAAGGGGFKGGMVGGGGGGVFRGDTAGRIGIAPQAGWSGPRPGWTGQHYYPRHRRFIGPGIGFGTGLLLGGAFATSPYYYDDPYYYESYPYDDGYVLGGVARSPEEVAYCRQRYRSYDIRTGTYLNNDGNRYPCP